jgi:hypothetical protein
MDEKKKNEEGVGCHVRIGQSAIAELAATHANGVLIYSLSGMR